MSKLLLTSGTILFFLFIQSSCFAQEYRPEKVSKKAVQFYEKAFEKASQNETREAISFLQQATEADENYADAWIALGRMQLELKNYPYSLVCFRRAQYIDLNYFKPHLISYATGLAGSGDFQKALETITKYIDQVKPTGAQLELALSRKRSYEFANQLEKEAQAEKNVTVFAPKNLGPSVNSKMSEYLPSQTIDGTQLFYTRRVDTYNEDFYGSTRVKNGNWESAQPLKGSLNTPQSEGAMMISQDGEWLVFTLKPRKVGQLQKIWDLISTQSNGNHNPVFLPIKENYTLRVADRVDMEEVIFM